MSLVKKSSHPMNQLQNEMNKLFSNWMSPFDIESSDIVTSSWTPAVDVVEEPERFIVHADLPGVKPEEIEITMENGMLSIKGERKTESEENKEGYRRLERSTGVFYRRFSLPDTADAERISAKGNNGVLEINIPKRATAKPKRISVNS